MPSYRSGCLSCTLGGYGGSGYTSHSSGSYGTGGAASGLRMLGSTSTSPHATSSRKEFRTEKQYMNGQPVYHMEHERRFQNGRLVHDKMVEKDEDDLGFVREPEFGYGGGQSSSSSNLRSRYNQAGGGYYTQPGYGARREESFVRGQTYSYGSNGAYGTDEHSSNLNSEVARMQENLRRQMMSYGSRQSPSYGGGNRRTEFRYQTRYVDGVPVYVKNEERKYENGQLVHNRTEEKGPGDLGTEDVVQQYDSSGAQIGSGGYHEQHQMGHEQSSIAYRGYSPTYSHKTEERRQESSSSYPSFTPGHSSSYSHESRPSYPTHRTAYGGSSSTRYSEESRHSSRPVYRPYGSSRTQHTEATQESSYHYPQRPAPGSSHTQETVETQESSSYYPHRPVPGSSRPSPGSPRRVPGGFQTQETVETQESSSYHPRRPAPGSSLTQETEEREETSTPYPSYRREHISPSTHHTEESLETSTSPSNRPVISGRPYPSYKPAFESSSTQYTEETRESSSSYRPSRPISGVSSTHYSQESHDSSSISSPAHVDATQQRHSGIYSVSLPVPDDMGATLVHQNVRTPIPDQSITRIVQESSESTHSRESSRGFIRPDGSSRPTGEYSDSQSEATEEHYPLLPSGDSSSGGARTHTIDLSSSSGSESSLTDQILHSGRVDQRYDTREEKEDLYSQYDSQHLDDHDDVSGYERQHVGIPGAITGPVTSDGHDDVYNKSRYDINPIEDGYEPLFPDVEYEIDTSNIPTLAPFDYEVDSSDFGEVDNDESFNGSPNQHRPRVDGSSDLHETHHARVDGSSDLHETRPNYSGSSSSYYYNSTHTREGNFIGQAAPSVDHTRYDSSRTSATDESRNIYPASTGSGYYHYNESRTHSSVSGSHQQPVPAPLPGTSSSSTFTSSCVQSSGCVIPIGSPQSSSQRTEIRTTSRYVNGRLVGMTHHERVYENGELVHENVTDHGSDELAGMDLSAYGENHLELAQGTYHPGSYSQQQELRQEKKYVNGQQVYDLQHERRFEDGELVYEDRTEKDEDDFGVTGEGVSHLGAGSLDARFDGEARHEVTETQQTQEHVTSGRVTGGGVGRSSQTHQVSSASCKLQTVLTLCKYVVKVYK